MGYVGRRFEDVEKLVKKHWSIGNANKALKYLRDGYEHFHMTHGEIAQLTGKLDELTKELNALIIESRTSNEKAVKNAENILTCLEEIKLILKKLRGLWSRF